MRTLQFSKIAIRSVSSSGIEYVDEQGAMGYIDFETCRANWVKEYKTSLETLSGKAASWYRRCVGKRDIGGNPAYIEFFTEPHTQLEFDNLQTEREDFWGVRRQLEDAGCATMDWS